MLETKSIVDALRSEMQSQILKGTIPPGTALTEVLVAQMFEVARPTAKAAIEQLVQNGLLRRTRHKTARVPLLNANDVTDLYLSRAVVERAAVRVLAERRQPPIGAIRALDRLRMAIASGANVLDLVESDVAFHRELVAATESPRLGRIHDLVIGETHLCMAQVQVHHLLHPDVIADEHARILAMIGTGDPECATAEIDSHISHSRDRLLVYLRQQEQPSAGSNHPSAEGAEPQIRSHGVVLRSEA
jgi:DNA-binding GntR family transcriptional regulator